MSNNAGSDGDRCNAGTSDNPIGGEMEAIMTLLSSVGITEIDTIECTGSVCVGDGRFVGDLNISAECILAMLVVFERLLMNNHTWAVVF